MWSSDRASARGDFPAIRAVDGKPWPVVVAERLALLREGLAALCELRMGLRVLAVCSDGEEALRAIRTHRPGVALLDLGLPRLSVHEVIRRVRSEELPSKLVVLSEQGDRKTVLEALRGGAHAFVLKSGSPAFLAEALNQVRGGSICVSPAIRTESLFTAQGEHAPEDPVDSLSAREHQVFTLLIEGLRAKEIAARLDLSAKTVDTYRASLMRKLDIHDVAGLVKFAIRRNLTGVK